METRIFDLILIEDYHHTMSLFEETVNTGKNGMVNAIRKAEERDKEQRHYISIGTVRHLGDECNLYLMEETPEDGIQMREYALSAVKTPLYRAMHLALAALEERLSVGDQAIVAIITDNNEILHCEPDEVVMKRKVEELKSAGWIFTYRGIGMDVVNNAAYIGITDAMTYESTMEGLEDLFQSLRVRYETD